MIFNEVRSFEIMNSAGMILKYMIENYDINHFMCFLILILIIIIIIIIKLFIFNRKESKKPFYFCANTPANTYKKKFSINN